MAKKGKDGNQLSLFSTDNPGQTPFDSIRHTDEQGHEYWLARELMEPLDYPGWREFKGVIKKAQTACRNSGNEVDNHFVLSYKMVVVGDGGQRKVEDFRLTRYACYLIAQNGNPRKQTIAEAQTYFVVQTQKQEYIEANPAWAAARLDGMVSRKAFTAALVEVVSNLPSNGIGIATNDVYNGVLHHTAKELNALLQTTSPRDKLTIPALNYLSTAEWVCSQRLGDAQEVPFDTARLIIHDIAAMIGAQADDLSRRLGMDLITGQKFIS